MMIMVEITGECDDHDPPHTVSVDRDRVEFPDPPCGGTISEYDIIGECFTCGEEIDGMYFRGEPPPDC